MTGPWSASDIQKARGVPLLKLLNHICDHLKEDRNYQPLDSSLRSRRFQVNCQRRDFRLIVTGEKWVDELQPRGTSGRGGGGAIDLASYLMRLNFVQAVRVCLEADKDLGDSAHNIARSGA